MTLDDLIIAIGKAEGWGLEKVNGVWRMRIYNPRTTAPFGLLGDAKKYPQLRYDPELLYQFMVGKLTGRVSDRVRALGVQGFSSTVVTGLIDPITNAVNPSFLATLAQKWAPVGAANDPNNLNVNWLTNVRNYLNQAGSAVGTVVSNVISGGTMGDPSQQAAAVVAGAASGMATDFFSNIPKEVYLIGVAILIIFVALGVRK